jgi:hypothetical protein
MAYWGKWMITVAEKSSRKNHGQAAIEMALALPFLIWLLYYTLNAFHTMHTSHVAQKFAALNLYRRLANRAQFAVDELQDALHGKSYMAVEYTDEKGAPPSRKILFSTQNPPRALNIIGICKEPRCD